MSDEMMNPDTVEVVDVQFRPGQKVYFFDPNGVQYRAGDNVIMDTARGEEYGTVTAGNHAIAQKDVVAPLRQVLRKATAQDERLVAENRQKEKRAFALCQQKIAEQGLDMQLVSAEYAFDGSKILFFFTADERVDFRELVKNLASQLHSRIELRQIGVRDKAKMVGGLGICGRPFCCHSFLDDFQPVSIKMAKTQNLSLNPTKISGTCGRLMCCLKYEQEAYEDLMKDAPRMDSFVETPDGVGTIISVNTLREKVRVRLDDEPDSLKTYHNSEIRVVRSGKGKRPEDYVEPPKEELAKLRKVTESPEDQYRREQAALAAALDDFLSEHGSKQQPEAHGSHSSRRRRGDKGKNAEKAEKALEAAVEREKEKQEAREKEKNSRRRHRTSGHGKKEFSAEAEPVKQQPEALKAPAEGKKEGTSRRRHRGGRGRGHGSGNSNPEQTAAQQSTQEKAKKAQQPKADHVEGKTEGGEKKNNRSHWHKRGGRRSGGGGKPTPPAEG